MLEESLFSLAMPYRQDMEVRSFSFGVTPDGRVLGGEGDAAARPEEFENAICFVAGIRGNEVQQTYICARLVHKLRRLEAEGSIVPGQRIMVVPCVNPASMNNRKRFWVGDNTDVNRMMPGYNLGETTQRIAAALFERVQGFRYGVHFSSYYLEGDFMEHVRVMNGPGIQTDNGADFGLAYVLNHVPGSFDTTTLHYNWRLWDTEAYTLYTKETDLVDENSAATIVRACLRFLDARGIIDRPCHGGMRSTTFAERGLVPVQVNCGGVFKRVAELGDIVRSGHVLAQVIDPLRGDVLEEVKAPHGGVVFFACRAPLVNEQTLAFQIVPRSISGDLLGERGNFLDPEA
ncbi:M14 family metallopeptidase [Slackia heliotrinireducens]|uniref:Predicted deacylase n=1 Tax=Slackia heliotrinireducens (strain ATCC 29202 / DSM 20476 / NCTC 11029 / RHS 1) TaxID=471855 RepID=C7N171_SLAHD|nr:M14 family metallopeptidase [Slackia heliotrinireducens]ACV23293.1 predicted deacylase [Slackia heliotrinireducens DSM 20476]VEH02472.1 Succinylglutamate desuccinylase / Aspartoacylase family [Slackia heliotrinireducens]